MLIKVILKYLMLSIALVSKVNSQDDGPMEVKFNRQNRD